MKIRTITVMLAYVLGVCLMSAQEAIERLTNLPTIYIETFDGANISSKTEYIYANMHYVDESDQVTYYDSLLIRGRGNSTWNMPKKPYRFKFKKKEKFLGKGYANTKKWTLLANAADKTLMRNAVTRALGEFTTLKFNPAAKFVDLVLNGRYVGNYQISDVLDVRPHRVNITEQDLPLTAESDITGGYLLEVDGFRDGKVFDTNLYSVPVRVHYPDDEDIVDKQFYYINNYVQKFENILHGDSFDDPETGYRSLVDTLSLLDWYIATEVSANIDGFYSTYFYKDQGDPLLYWGPLWDYDIAYGNDSRKGDTSRQLMVDVGYGATRFWMNRMWEDEWFSAAVNRRYGELLDAGLENCLYQTIDSLHNLLDESQRLNYQRWGINTRVYNERVLYSSYEQYVEDLKAFIGIHIPYLKEAFAKKQPEKPTPAFVPEDSYYHIASANSGKVIQVEGMSDETASGIVTGISDEELLGQEWVITVVGEGVFHITNRLSGMALNDPTVGEATATTNVGTQLNVAVANPDDDRQLWRIVPQGTAGYYNLVNLHTDHTMNLSNGNTGEGVPIISYTTDTSRNATSLNRLWYIIATTPIESDDPDNPDDPGVPDNLGSIEPDEYALAYNNDTHILHFGAERPEQLTFTARVYAANGRLVGSFRADQTFSTAQLSAGIYVVSWNVSGKTRSIKFAVR